MMSDTALIPFSRRGVDLGIYAEYVSPCSNLSSSPGDVFPEVRIVPLGGLLVNHACNFGAFDENGAREKEVTVREVNLCLRRETAEQLFDDFLYRAQGIRRDSSRGTTSRSQMRVCVAGIGHDPIATRAAIDRPKTCSSATVVRDAIELVRGHAVEDRFGGDGRMMQHAQCW